MVQPSHEETTICRYVRSLEICSLVHNCLHPNGDVSFEVLDLCTSIVKKLRTGRAVFADSNSEWSISSIIQGIHLSEWNEALWITIEGREAEVVVAPDEELAQR